MPESFSFASVCRCWSVSTSFMPGLMLHPQRHPGKTVLTDAAGQVDIQVPRDRADTFEPVVVAKRQRRLSDVDAVAISWYA